MYEYTQKIRDIINKQRKSHILSKNRALWNQLLSSLDAIEDTQEAIDAYSASEFRKGKRGEYLAIYGLLQALYVQQDAIKNLGESLKIPITLKDYPALEYIRNIRNRSIGHPTKKGETNEKKDKPNKEKPNSYHFISRTTLCPKGFQLLSFYYDGKREFKDISTVDLIADQGKYISEILISVTNKLEQEEMAHKEKFRDEKLTSIFPDSLDYHFQKLLESAESKERNKLGVINLRQIKKSLEDFRETLANRGIELETYDSIKYVYEQIEYPLNELEGFFQISKKEQGSNIDDKAAYIFAFFIEKQFDELKRIAKDIDMDYSR